MTTAVLIEAYHPAGNPQILLTYGTLGTIGYTRMSDGGKGGQNRWIGPHDSWEGVLRQTEFVERLRASSTYRVIPQEPTQNDLDQLREGFPRVLFQKMSRRLEKRPFMEFAATSPLTRAELEWKGECADPKDSFKARDVAAQPPTSPTSPEVAPAPQPKPAPSTARWRSSDTWPTWPEPEPSPEPSPEPKPEPSPEPEPAERQPTYINRVLAGGVQDFKMLDYALANRDNVLLYGPTQSGKTSLPLAFAEARGMRCVTISGDAAMDPSELFGQRTLVGGNAGYEENHVTQVIRDGGVLVIDEINMFSQKILSPLFSLLDKRREIRIKEKGGEVVKAHPNLLIVATMNPRYAGTASMSEALLDRFAHRHEWGYDPDVEARLVPSESLRGMFSKARANGDLDTPMSTSLMITFAQDVKGLGFAYARENLANRAMDSEEREVLRQLLTTYRMTVEAELGTRKPEPESEPKKEPSKWGTPAPTPLGAAPWDY